MSVLSDIIAESISHKFIADVLHYLSMDRECDRRTRDRVFHAVAELLRVRLQEENGKPVENFEGSGFGIDEFGDEELLNFFLRNDT